MKQRLIVYWARRDLRLHDNRALLSALHESRAQELSFLPVFVIEPYMTNGDPREQFGAPSRWFLTRAIPELAKQFERFLVLHERPARYFAKLAKQFDIEVFVNEDIHPDFYRQIRKIREAGVQVKLFRDQLTISKETKTGSGNEYSVFTPFKNAVWTSFVNEGEDPKARFHGIRFVDLREVPGKHVDWRRPKALEELFSAIEGVCVGDDVIHFSSLHIPERDLSEWYVSEEQAKRHWTRFRERDLERYREARNFLGESGASRLSLALTWGLLTARTLVADLRKTDEVSLDAPQSARAKPGVVQFVSELIWREFYKYLFFHRPELIFRPFQKRFEHLSWVRKDVAQERFLLWMQGKTGFPIVDAAMQELAQTGWMQNRARMIVASILTKHLGVDWRWGQEYFRAMLIDLDEASNAGGWQWGASVGADPKPIRIFNPYLQAKEYDPEGKYQTKWLSHEYRSTPLAPVVEHEIGRREALRRYGLLR